MSFAKAWNANTGWNGVELEAGGLSHPVLVLLFQPPPLLLVYLSPVSIEAENVPIRVFHRDERSQLHMPRQPDIGDDGAVNPLETYP
jgi:hypothetical protein